MLTEKSAERETIVRRLAEDLVGPRADDEVLVSRPTDTYLTGVLWPQRTAMGGEEDDSLAVGGARGGDDGEDSEASAVPYSSVQKPSVAGISFSFMSAGTAKLKVVCSFARYRLREGAAKDEPRWVRTPVEVSLTDIDFSNGTRTEKLGDRDPRAEGVLLHIRCIDGNDRKLATVSLINAVEATEGRDGLELATLFQTAIKITAGVDTLLVPRVGRASAEDHDQSQLDEDSAELLFRNAHVFAAGHTCSAVWSQAASADRPPTADWIATSWLPSAIVPGISASGHEVFGQMKRAGVVTDPLDARALAEAQPDELRTALTSLCDRYEDWIAIQERRVPGLEPACGETAKLNLKTCRDILGRMRGAVASICDQDDLRHAFQLANFVMHIQHGWDPEKAKRGTLRWRPFQLAFLILSAPSSVDRGHEDRGVMDLLWFPTGGGKTEAYLALVALVSIHRRLASPVSGDGVAALMRYTLRLLTTQQFARSAAMILACEAIRTGKVSAPHAKRLSTAPAFSIGLWVGRDASPNKLAMAWASLQGSREVSSPKQLASCPACQIKLAWTQASVASPVVVKCETAACVLKGQLPVWTVDEDLYRERPTLVIGTVDKFAQIVREPATNGLFGIAAGSPPDLIIQDELHLISGPLGTVAGTYEAAFDLLFSLRGVRPKVIGSTATIRRASEQIRDLFDRTACQFPPPAIDQEDSGFAAHNPEAMGRRYVGISTAGRSAKFTLQAVSASLLQSAAEAFSETSAQDPYWTLVGYFNSLRELGGALVLMQDDVTDSIRVYAEARGETARPMKNVEELTSRRTQEEVLRMLDTLAIRVGEPGALDAILATNMVSVGVDIPRLGLMLVNGQPKTTAEYIQSTSRVGRGEISGLVVSILNNAKARDRSHFETFAAWHSTLYRDVEATSVTPFASRARDRSLHAALVAAVRHLAPGMLTSPNMSSAAEIKARELISLIVDRASRIDPEEPDVRAELENRLESWIARDPRYYWQDYKDRESLLQSAERAAWKKALGRQSGAAWSTLNSMRTVEAGTPFRLAPALRRKGTAGGE
jgi:hypothetical protein